MKLCNHQGQRVCFVQSNLDLGFFRKYTCIFLIECPAHEGTQSYETEESRSTSFLSLVVFMATSNPFYLLSSLFLLLLSYFITVTNFDRLSASAYTFLEKGDSWISFKPRGSLSSTVVFATQQLTRILIQSRIYGVFAVFCRPMRGQNGST